MKSIIDHHHYKKNLIDGNVDRVAVYERYVVDILLNSEVLDSQRDSSIAFELMHHHSTAQFARVMARQRSMPVDVCTVGALLHDLHVVRFGDYKDHAHKSAVLASEIINEIGLFSWEEKQQIIAIIYHHSDKEIWSDNPFEEFGKDVDILDSFLYPNAFGYYLKHKSLRVFYNYVLRAKKVWSEVNIPQPIEFSILDNYQEDWLDKQFSLEYTDAVSLLGVIIQASRERNTLTVPTLLIRSEENEIHVKVNSDVYSSFLDRKMGNVELAFSVKSEVKELLDLSRQAYVVIWSAIDAFEVLLEADNAVRLKELGLNVPVDPQG
jgi:hypothetical protein